MPPVVLPTFFPEKETAACLAVSMSTLRRWRRSHTGPDHFRFGGVLRYRCDDLDRFIAKNTSTAA
jgi:hypothetical protein